MRDREHALPRRADGHPPTVLSTLRPAGEAVVGLVLCGGRSRRMGRDKATLRVGDATLLERAAAALSTCDEVWLAPGVARRDGLPPALADARQVLDGGADLGPLAGLAAGLQALREARGDAWLCALACDMPLADTATVEALLAAARADGADAALMVADGRDEPLFAVYHARLASVVADALADGERRLVGFHERMATLDDGATPAPRRPRVVRVDALRAELAANVNTPADLASARRRLGCEAGAPRHTEIRA